MAAAAERLAGIGSVWTSISRCLPSRLFLAAPTQGTKPFSASAESLRAPTGTGSAKRGMTRVTLVLVLVVMLAAVGGCLFLAYWHFDVPRTDVEKVLPDARFPK
jgi:hypothetical protein